MENIREFAISTELEKFLNKKRTLKEMELTASKMFLLLEYQKINFNEFENIAFEFMFRYSVYSVRQNGKEIRDILDIPRRWKDFCNVYNVEYNLFVTVKMLLDNINLTDEEFDILNSEFPLSVEMMENGHDYQSAKQEIKNRLLYKSNK